MATLNSIEYAQVNDPANQGKVGVAKRASKVRVDIFTILGTQGIASGDVVRIARIPAGANVLFGALHENESKLIRIGIAGNTNKYLTDNASPDFFGPYAGNLATELAAEEEILLTIAGTPSAAYELRGFICYNFD